MSERNDPPPAAHVGTWLERNTFHHDAFRDVKSLVAEKERLGLRISVCIPTLNEAETVGKVVAVLKSELVDRIPLVDELAVIDSESTDGTCGVAAEAGADVYRSGDILPRHGFKRGKGENLWKAVHQLEGDIVCYIDGDISNIHPRFVAGLVGPLIGHGRLKYVKAFYDRPVAGSGHPGGGRVTEILVRPLFSLFYPELSAIVQPLSGEYAARREVLERIPFPVGYGVEMAHLLDVYRLWGMEAFGQTDLDRRVHRHQPTSALGRMAFGILQTFLHRAQAHGLVAGLPELSRIYRGFLAKGDDYRQIAEEIVEEERPPMIAIPEYREKFGLAQNP